MKTVSIMIVGVGGQGSLLASKLLGNLLTDGAEDILNCDRARRIKEGFSRGKAEEDLCRRCGFAKQRFG